MSASSRLGEVPADEEVSVTITVYTKPDCVQCIQTKKRLEAKGLSFNVIDVSEDKEARKVVSNTGIYQMPYVTVERDGKLVDSWHGFKDDKIKDLTRDS